MKIAILTSPFGSLPPLAIGAVEKLFCLLGGIFQQQGHSVLFYCAGGGEEGGCHCVKIVGYARTGSLAHDLVLDFFYSIRALLVLQRTDILLCNTFWSPFLAPLVRWKYKKLVYGVHRYPKRQFVLYPFVHQFICVSSVVRDVLVNQHPFLSKRSVVISNPVDDKVFMPQQRGCCLLAPPVVKIMYTGRIHPEKGLDLLVSAYRVLRERGYSVGLTLVGARAVGAGGGGVVYREQLDLLANGYPIEWVDPVFSPKELAAKLMECDIYCYPSVAEHGETFGLAPLEAMAVGRVVVVSALACFTDFIQDGVTGVIFNHRSENVVDCLVEKIEFLVNHPEKRIQIATAGSRVAHEGFSAELIAGKYLNVFKQLLEG